VLHSAPVAQASACEPLPALAQVKTTQAEACVTKPAPLVLLPSIPVDLLFDNHAVELEECRRWANSDAGQIARIENPAGFANVRAHAEAHLRAIGLAYARQQTEPVPTPPPAKGAAS
jgi:hypothetical protein